MREALGRTMVDRFAWFWMIAEPVIFVVVMIGIRQVMGRFKTISGAEFVPWLIVGLMVFILFRTIITKSRGAIDSNRALFAYRQLHPIDPVLIRAAMDGLIQTFVFIIFILGGLLLGFGLGASDPLLAVTVWILAWVFSSACALIVSVAVELIHEIKIIVQVSMLPLMLISGVIFPVTALPHDLKQYLVLNPILHLIELMRLSFFDDYHSLTEISLLYVTIITICLHAFGLALHMRFKDKIKSL